ncbi:MAG: methyltransferase, partial [Rikenellaceae bacterium]|nr:methyltransferase [Rikenellaceae bacterium]
PTPPVTAPHPYDLIVCNPPYFTSSLLPPDRQREMARHDASLGREDLIRCAAALSRPGTLLALIIPTVQTADYIVSADLGGFALTRRTDVRTTPGSPPKRTLLEFRFGPHPAAPEPLTNTLVIETSPQHFTEEYMALTRDFYLKF